MFEVLFFLILLGVSSFYAFKVWFRTDEYLTQMRRRRQKARGASSNFFEKMQLPTANYLGNHPSLDIWSARLATLLMVIVLSIAVLAAFARIP